MFKTENYRWFSILVFSALFLGNCGIFEKKKPKGIVTNTEQQKEIYYQAEAAFTAGNFGEAQVLFQKFVDQSPKPASGYYRLACLSKMQRKYEEALNYISKATHLDPTNIFYYEMFEAEVYRSKKEYTQAGNIYENWAVKTSGKWSLYQDASRMFQMSGEYNRMIMLCTNWEKAFNLREEIVNARVYAYQRKNKKDSVAFEYEKLTLKYPERRQYKISLAQAWQEAGKEEKATAIYNELLKSDPENGEILNPLCRFYHSKNDPRNLWNIAQKTVQSHQLNFEQKQSCMLFLLQPKNNIYFDSLAPILMELTRQHSNKAESWLMLADWYYTKKEFGNASNMYSQSLQIFSNFSAWLKYSSCLDRLRYNSHLQKVADTLLELFPSNPTIYRIQADAFANDSKWEKAKEACETGLSYAVEIPGKTELNITLAYILNHLNNQEESYKMLKGLTSSEKDVESMLALADLYAINNTKLDEAENWVSNAKLLVEARIEKYENNPTNMLANCYIIEAKIKAKQNENEKALKSIHRAINIDSFNSEAWETQGDIEKSMGNTTAMKASYLNASKLSPGDIKLYNLALSH